MTKSIISNEKECFVCGDKRVLHLHHIYEGLGRRQQSDKWGCWVYLCPRHHNMSNEGVHFNKELDLKLKRLCQKRFEELYPDVDFIKEFRRSYL